MGLRVKDGGESESQPVMGWIGDEPLGDFAPRESGQTSTGSLVARKLMATPKQEFVNREQPSSCWREPALFSERKFTGTGVVFSVVS